MRSKTMWKHLKKEDRKEIEYYLSKWYSHRKIWKIMKIDNSVISREIKRNSVDWKYQWDKASVKSYQRRYYVNKQSSKIIMNMDLREYIEKYIKLGYKPDSISWKWNKEEKERYNLSITTKTIYNYIENKDNGLGYILCKKKYKQRWSSNAKKEIIPYKTSIHDRPKHIDIRKYVWDFEGDLICSKKWDRTSLLTLYDRKSRLGIIRRIGNKQPEWVKNEIVRLNKKYNMKSITFDNWLEFRNHYKLHCMGIKTYFCDTYSSWQKWGVENFNKMVRAFLPKWTILRDVSDEAIESIMNFINSIPRKSLNYCSAEEVYFWKSND